MVGAGGGLGGEALAAFLDVADAAEALAHRRRHGRGRRGRALLPGLLHRGDLGAEAEALELARVVHAHAADVEGGGAGLRHLGARRAPRRSPPPRRRAR